RSSSPTAATRRKYRRCWASTGWSSRTWPTWRIRSPVPRAGRPVSTAPASTASMSPARARTTSSGSGNCAPTPPRAPAASPCRAGPAFPRDMPGSLIEAAHACLAAASVEAKLGTTFAAAAAFRRGELVVPDDAPAPGPVRMPGRPARPRLVHPRELPRRGLGSEAGRAAFIHAIAHIEFNAIDLAWDAVYRFRGMPAGYYAD